jgi:hypothetical protein
MKIFQHFFDVLVPNYNIVILNFKYHTLYGILFQELHVGQYFLSIQIIVTTQTKFPCKLPYLQESPIMNKPREVDAHTQNSFAKSLVL